MWIARSASMFGVGLVGWLFGWFVVCCVYGFGAFVLPVCVGLVCNLISCVCCLVLG